MDPKVALREIRASEERTGQRDLLRRRAYNIHSRIRKLRSRTEVPLPDDAPEAMRVILDRATRLGEEQIKLLGGAVFIEDFDSDSEDEDSVQGDGEGADMDALDDDEQGYGEGADLDALDDDVQGYGEGADLDALDDELEEVVPERCLKKLAGRRASDLEVDYLPDEIFEIDYHRLDNDLCFKYDELEKFNRESDTPGDLRKFASFKYGATAAREIVFSRDDIDRINTVMRQRSIDRNPEACAQVGAKGVGFGPLKTWGDVRCVGPKHAKSIGNIEGDFYDRIVLPFIEEIIAAFERTMLQLIDGLEKIITETAPEVLRDLRDEVIGIATGSSKADLQREREEERDVEDKLGMLDRVTDWGRRNKGKLAAAAAATVALGGIAATGGVAGLGAAAGTVAGAASANPGAATALGSAALIGVFGSRPIKFVLDMMRKIVSGLCSLLRWMLRNPAGTVFLLKVATVLISELCNYYIQRYLDDVMYWTSGMQKPPFEAPYPSNEGEESIVLLWDLDRSKWVIAEIQEIDDGREDRFSLRMISNASKLTADQKRRFKAWEKLRKDHSEDDSFQWETSLRPGNRRSRRSDIVQLWEWEHASRAGSGTKYAIDISNVEEFASILKLGAPSAFVQAIRTGRTMEAFEQMVNFGIDSLFTYFQFDANSLGGRIFAQFRVLTTQGVIALNRDWVRDLMLSSTQLWQLWKTPAAVVDTWTKALSPCIEKAVNGKMTTTSCRVLQTRDRCMRARHVKDVSKVRITIEFMTEQERRSFRAYRYTIFRQGSTTGMLDESVESGRTVMTVILPRGQDFQLNQPVKIYPTQEINDLGLGVVSNEELYVANVVKIEVMKPLLMVETICRWDGVKCDATKTADLVYGDAVETIQVLYQAVTNIVYGLNVAVSGAINSPVTQITVSMAVGGWAMKLGLMSASSAGIGLVLLLPTAYAVAKAGDQGWFDAVSSWWSNNSVAKKEKDLFERFMGMSNPRARGRGGEGTTTARDDDGGGGEKTTGPPSLEEIFGDYPSIKESILALDVGLLRDYLNAQDSTVDDFLDRMEEFLKQRVLDQIKAGKTLSVNSELLHSHRDLFEFLGDEGWKRCLSMVYYERDLASLQARASKAEDMNQLDKVVFSSKGNDKIDFASKVAVAQAHFENVFATMQRTARRVEDVMDFYAKWLDQDKAKETIPLFKFAESPRAMVEATLAEMVKSIEVKITSRKPTGMMEDLLGTFHLGSKQAGGPVFQKKVGQGPYDPVYKYVFSDGSWKVQEGDGRYKDAKRKFGFQYSLTTESPAPAWVSEAPITYMLTTRDFSFQHPFSQSGKIVYLPVDVSITS